MKLSPELEPHRVRAGTYASPEGAPFGAFCLPAENTAGDMVVIADDGEQTGWEHVSVSLCDRTPTWDEMCRVKSLFWAEDATVLQFHPAKSNYVNVHPHCLHLWRKRGKNITLPPTVLV